MSRPSFEFIRRLQKSLLRLLLASDDLAIFLVQECAMVLTTRVSVLDEVVILCWV